MVQASPQCNAPFTHDARGTAALGCVCVEVLGLDTTVGLHAYAMHFGSFPLGGRAVLEWWVVAALAHSRCVRLCAL